ncbi:helix-turn-helix transcriptional regulator [Streptomyces sp. NPDC096323]|uniref:helix-turn-helix transcriptional regulator n=1 Tax=Streptomyces sp. NPDC096323 TaxID=3155822 RepID=UPI00331856AC
MALHRMVRDERSDFRATNPGKSDAPIGDIGVTLYAYAEGRQEVSRAELLMASGESAAEDEVLAAVHQLMELGLLRATGGDPERLVAVPPATVSADLLLPAMRALQEHQREFDRAYAGLAALTPVYASSARGGMDRCATQVITDHAGVRRAIAELAAHCTKEVLASRPGGARPEEALQESQEHAARLLERGAGVRTLYHHTAQFSQPTVEFVGMLTERGAEVRTVGDAFAELLVFDGEVAVMPLRDHPAGAVVVRDPNVVDFAVASFERTWSQGTPFPYAYNREHVLSISEDLKLAVIRLLVEGYEDKVIAKRLGMSLRTYQRHLSGIMRRIDARNRLHAGYLIHKLHLLERDS